MARSRRPATSIIVSNAAAAMADQPLYALTATRAGEAQEVAAS